MRRAIYLGLAFPLITITPTAEAHHSSAPHYDASKPIRIEGTVTAFEFVNPHSFVHVRVVDASGTAVVWDCEMPASVMLRRQGWTPDKLVPGEKITVRGIAARRDPHGCSLQYGVLADGSEFRVRGPGGPEAAESSQSASAGAAPKGGLGAIAGTWVRDLARRPNGRAAGPGPADRGPPGPEAFTAVGWQAQSGYDQRFDDPSFQCSAASITRAWSEPGEPTAIELADGRVTIRHEYMDTVRTVDLSMRAHPQEITPTLYGHSVGWLEGETLVIDTVGFTAGVLAPHPGILHSDALHVVERLTADVENKTLRVAWTAEDPKFFAKPLSGEFLFVPTSYAVQPYGCTVEHANR